MVLFAYENWAVTEFQIQQIDIRALLSCVLDICCTGEDIKIIFFRKLVNIRLEVVKFKRKLIVLYD
jgi:hypothetical protein